MSILVIGDIHGRLDLLEELIKKAPLGVALCFVGDLIDRGPSSAEVVKFVREGGHHCVLGNHEDMMAKSVLVGGHYFGYGTQLWMTNFGTATLTSYGIESPKEYYNLRDLGTLPPKMVEDATWMRDLPVYQVFDDPITPVKLVVSHSGILPFWNGRDTEDGREGALWDRSFLFEESPGTEDLINVFGHTPLKNPTHISNSIGIDTGAFYTNRLTGYLWPEGRFIGTN